MLSLTFLEILASSATTASTALLMPRWSEVGFAPAVTLLETFAVDGLGEHGRGGGAVTGDVAGLAGDFAHELGAHVFVRIFEFDFLGDGDTVLGDRRAAEFLVENDVAAARAEGRLDGFARVSRCREAAPAARFRQM